MRDIADTAHREFVIHDRTLDFQTRVKSVDRCLLLLKVWRALNRAKYAAET